MLRSIAIFFILALFLGSCSSKLNRYNKKKQRTGKWIMYYDAAKTKKSFDGKFRNGISVGTCYYYNIDGVLDKREIKCFGKIKTVVYNSNGTINHKGNAKIDNLTDRIHYYFYGKWTFFDSTGKVLKYCYYKKGILVRTEYKDKNNKTNDSLIFALNAIDKRFKEKNEALLDTLSHCWSNQILSEKYRLKIYAADSVSFQQVQRLLEIYGYPKKEVCHESADIPFFIISHAPVNIRERYVELFRAAAGIGELSKISLAFYIDKVKLSRNEKQVYGTQYYMDKNGKDVYYPSIDPDNLKVRRAEMGLQ